MPICIYIEEGELRARHEAIKDKDILECLKNLKEIAGDLPFYVEERIFPCACKKGFLGLFNKPQHQVLYCVYYPRAFNEVETVAFCPQPESYYETLCTWITREQLADFLIGWGQGYVTCRERSKKS